MNLRKNYRYLLVLSLCLMALGMALTLLFDSERDILDAPIYRFVLDMPLAVVFFFIVIFAPITEEIAFRSWACKKKAWTWVSFVASSLFVFLFNIYAGIIYSIIFLAIIFLFKDKPKHRLFSFLILTSLTFAIMHYDNLQPKSFYLAFAQYLGAGLFFAYFALRFNLLTAIIVHAINNFIAIAAMGLIFSSNETNTLENTTYKFTLSRVAPQWSFGGRTTSTFGIAEISIERYTIGSIAESLIEYSDTSYWVIDNEVTDFRKYNMRVERKDTNSKIDYRELLIDLAKLKKIQIDTIQEKRLVWVLNAKDWDSISYKEDDLYNYDPLTKVGVYSLCSQLSVPIMFEKEKTLDVIPQKGVYDRTIWIDKNVFYQKSFEQKKKTLETRYSITLTKKDTLINVIRIRGE